MYSFFQTYTSHIDITNSPVFTGNEAYTTVSCIYKMNPALNAISYL